MKLASILQIATLTLGMAVVSRADQIVLDVTFQSSGTNQGNYAAGTDVGNPVVEVPVRQPAVPASAWEPGCGPRYAGPSRNFTAVRARTAS